MKYYARLDDDDMPVILYRATSDMREQAWSPSRGWIPAEFLLDVLEGHGSIYYIKENKAKEFFPPKAFL